MTLRENGSFVTFILELRFPAGTIKSNLSSVEYVSPQETTYYIKQTNEQITPFAET